MEPRRKRCRGAAVARGGEAVAAALACARRYGVAAAWIDASTRLANRGGSTSRSEALLTAAIAALEEVEGDVGADALRVLASDKLCCSLLRRGATAAAEERLRTTGVSFRYADGVWTGSMPLFRGVASRAFAIEAFAPPSTLRSLRAIFAEGADFWTAHDYDDPATGYFSYVEAVEAVGGVLGSLARRCLALLVSRGLVDGDDPTIHVEWWAHTKPSIAGHELHFDADVASGRLPYASVVLMLEDADGVGGSTLVTNQTPSDGVDPKALGLVAPCVRNQLLAFEGALFHGVLPGAPSPSKRTSLMMSFWDGAIGAPSSEDARPRAAMRHPRPADARPPEWAKALLFSPPPEWTDSESDRPAVDAPLLDLDPLWVPIDSDDADASPPPEAFFQGVTTWRALLPQDDGVRPLSP